MTAANSVLSASKRRRGIGRPWAKGCSGNPRGRPRTTVDVREMAQAYGVAAINRLAMMGGLAVDALGQPIKGAESEATQLSAIRELLDRGYGKPTQPVEGDGERPSTVVFHWAKAGETDDAPVVEHEPVTTVTEITTPPPRFVLHFEGDDLGGGRG